MIKKILVPLDGSPAGEAVLSWVQQIASATEAEVLLVGAVTPLAVWDEANAAVKWEAEEATAGDYIAAKRNELAGGGLNVRSRVFFGPAAKVVLSTAAEEGVDLIAMTTHGRSGVVRLMLGSVATKVVHESEIPVLLVRPPERGSAASAPTIKKILVPLDGSDLSQAVLPLAEEMAELFDAAIVLFYAITPLMPTIPGTEAITMNQRVWDAIRDEATEFLRSVGRQVSARGHRTEEILTMAPIVDGILSAAETQKAGLIVIGTHGRSGLGRWIMGSVADAVIRRSQLPVLVVRPRIEAES